MCSCTKTYEGKTQDATANGEFDRVILEVANGTSGTFTKAVQAHAEGEAMVKEGTRMVKDAKAAIVKIAGEGAAAPGDEALTKYLRGSGGTATVSRTGEDREEEVETTDWTALFEAVRAEIGDNRANDLFEAHTTRESRVVKGKPATASHVKKAA